jgi:hypothetical protein
MTARVDSALDALRGTGYRTDDSVDCRTPDGASGGGGGIRRAIDRLARVTDCPSDDTHDHSLVPRSLWLQTA